MPQNPSIEALSRHLPGWDILCSFPAFCEKHGWYIAYPCHCGPMAFHHSSAEMPAQRQPKPERIISSAHSRRNNIPSISIQNGAQVRFASIPLLEFCDSCQPFFIGPASSKFSVQNIFSDIIGTPRQSRRFFLCGQSLLLLAGAFFWRLYFFACTQSAD